MGLLPALGSVIPLSDDWTVNVNVDGDLTDDSSVDF